MFDLVQNVLLEPVIHFFPPMYTEHQSFRHGGLAGSGQGSQKSLPQHASVHLGRGSQADVCLAVEVVLGETERGGECGVHLFPL